MAGDAPKDDKYKIIVVGAGAVGKSSLTIRYVIGDFFEHYDPTIEDYYRKLVEVDKKPAYLDILDTAGQAEFASMQEQFYRQGRGFLIVYSIDSPNSFQYAKELRDKISQARYDDQPDFAVVLVGNKCDLDAMGKRKVPAKLGEKLAKEWGCPFVETSAKTQLNTAQAFQSLVREIRNVYKYTDEEETKSKPGKGSGFSICTIL
mmetsp:Transcript_31913/g.51279  ORF Transcript_31913/g.51279 Transcript_31913/m.51279 type:complete len:204 (-) Transcript_31913:487-1098(-)|eukprot:CAMPEP_0197021528 /NCGR_PEP_ID=MMETSP1384-20130603/2419_1 /TAXON_ID=29189 /ORGANISM="Ammonia sp." /LENGTH=203 /DNA_ID=CAMNT_0042449371 /DNA_START=113 /DNA_END=724 /DNA_ORIENTATION=+